jgi:hypothetical protein
MTNLTVAQPFSPTVMALHKPALTLFDLGAPASSALEALAEGGSTAPLLQTLTASADSLASRVADGALAPGASVEWQLEANVDAEAMAQLTLSAVSMLVNTNDAVVAIQGVNLATLTLGQQLVLTALAYDAGTERNSETAATLPGPVAMGEGFNPQRDDALNAVRVHAGVLTAAQGLSGSVLTPAHTWDNPVARIVITRVEP